MKQKRAQSAVEFLITYGWAFLVILVVIGALIYFDVLSPTRFIPDSCRTDNPQFVCAESVFAADEVQFLLRNSGNSAIKFNETDYAHTVTSSGCTANALNCGTVTPHDIPPGGELACTLSCHDGLSGAAVGERLAATLILDYEIPSATITQRTLEITLSGNLR